MELHQMVNEVYTNSIYMPNTNHITLNRETGSHGSQSDTREEQW
jgi:hypothetical protein